MYKIAFSFLITSLLLCSCGDAKQENNLADAAISKADNPVYQEGLQLVAKSDCLGCHKIGEAAIGPSYKAIAAKYADNPENVNMLAGKIINGGVGVWGQVPMSAHPVLTEADAKKMVQYILLLKK